jgi:hypothetical protein
MVTLSITTCKAAGVRSDEGIMAATWIYMLRTSYAILEQKYSLFFLSLLIMYVSLSGQVIQSGPF